MKRLHIHIHTTNSSWTLYIHHHVAYFSTAKRKLCTTHAKRKAACAALVVYSHPFLQHWARTPHSPLISLVLCWDVYHGNIENWMLLFLTAVNKGRALAISIDVAWCVVFPCNRLTCLFLGFWSTPFPRYREKCCRSKRWCVIFLVLVSLFSHHAFSISFVVVTRPGNRMWITTISYLSYQLAWYWSGGKI